MTDNEIIDVYKPEIIIDGNPCERLRRVLLGKDTPEQYRQASRDFEEYMKQLIGSMSYDEWLEEWKREAKKRGF